MDEAEAEDVYFEAELSRELKAEKDRVEELIVEARDLGFLYDTHLEPLAIVLSYLETPETTLNFYNMMSSPGNDPIVAMNSIDPLLTIYAGRRESIFRSGLTRKKNTHGVDTNYCVLQALPLVGGPVIKGLEDIFGEEAADRISSDQNYLPMNKTYVCCCHNLTENRIPSQIFLAGNQKTMRKFIPDTREISDNISIDELCPYEGLCTFKKAYLSQPRKPGLRIINNPLENAQEVFRERVESTKGTEVYNALVGTAKRINTLSDMVYAHQKDPYNVNGRKADMLYI